MKELSIEQKAKRYDEVIPMAKECIIYVPGETANRHMLNMFPELKESDDDRIRESIINFLTMISSLKDGKTLSNEDFDSKEILEWVAWLEKQREQKHVDKIEPKFHEGDWVVTDKGDTVQIGTVNNDYYTIGNGMLFSMPYVDTSWHLWTIKDAKKGDVLANDHNILILKESVYDRYTNGTPYSVKAYCGIKPNGNFEIGLDNWSFCGTLYIHPATKEQRDILFQKMKEDGYVWNEDKKELIKL